MKKTILIVGGAGYIGSHVNKLLNQQGFETVILDNLSTGNREAVIQGNFIQGDIGDTLLLNRLFTSFPIEAVMHFAAYIDVGESVNNPAKYYQNNVANTLNLLEAMNAHGVKKFIFSSTAAVYGVPQEGEIKEDHPTSPLNPYGESKLMVEKILKDFDQAYNFRFCSLRYFNAAGGDPEGQLKNYKIKETNLIPVALRSILQKKFVTIFGTDYPTFDGTCIRDYIHVFDLGKAHIQAMEHLFQNLPSTIYNLGNGKGFSVKEVLSAIERVTGEKLRILEGLRRPGDPPILVSNADKARKELHWEPQYRDLDTMIAHAWKALTH